MSAKNPIRVFVTHCFASHPDYHRVYEYMESTANFFYQNCSVPDHAPQGGGKEALKEEYRTQLKTAEVVIVLSTLYVEKVPPEIAKRAAEIVDWNERQIVDAIRRQARGEATNRWETIEFKL